MAWPSTKSDGDTISSGDWNNIVQFAARKDSQNTQTTGTYDLTGGNESGFRDGTAFSGMFFHTAGTRIMSAARLELKIDTDGTSTDSKLMVTKDSALIGAGTVLLEVREDGSLYAPNLPTSDPAEAGVIWNDSGTLKVSAG